MVDDTDTVLAAADQLEQHLTRPFTVADHLDDRDKAALLELAKRVI